VDVGEAIEVRHNFAFLSVKHDELICVHVGDVKAPMRGVETLIIETDCATWQWYVRNQLQWRRLLVGGGNRGCNVTKYRNQYCYFADMTQPAVWFPHDNPPSQSHSCGLQVETVYCFDAVA
jgi:hypothetical protein